MIVAPSTKDTGASVCIRRKRRIETTSQIDHSLSAVRPQRSEAVTRTLRDPHLKGKGRVRESIREGGRGRHSRGHFIAREKKRDS